MNIEGLNLVPGFPDYCYDLDWNVYRRTPKLGTFPGRKCSSYINSEGRVAWNLRRPDGKPATIFRSAIVCTHYHGPRPEGMKALHNNGDPSEDTRDNLRWGTQAENMADRAVHGRQPKWSGETHPRAKLTWQDVRAIRASSARHVDLARDYGVTPGLIQHIRKNIIWKEAA